MRDLSCDILVLGAGPGGYVAAIRAGQLGKSTIIVEETYIGGVCLNVGCIPSKALLHAAKVYREAQAADWLTGEIAVNLPKLMTHKEAVVSRLTEGVAQLLKANKVQTVMGRGTFTGPTTLSVATEGETTNITFGSAIIATGSSPLEIPSFPFSNPAIVTSTEALAWSQVPETLVIIGGGAIGLEMATFWNRMGSKVTVVEMMEQIIPGNDPDVARALERALRKQGIEFHTGAKAEGYEAGNVKVIAKDGSALAIPASKVLVSVGRKPNSTDIGLEAVGVNLDERGWVPSDDSMRTNVPTIFSIGDLRGPPLLAHKASKEAIVAAEAAAGLDSTYLHQVMPAVVYTDPEVATTGLTELQARAEYGEIKVAKFPFSASGRALANSDTEGFCKIISTIDDLVLGVAMVGGGVGELISEASLGIEMGATGADFGLVIHPHPTLSEALMEAAEMLHQKAIHTINR